MSKALPQAAELPAFKIFADEPQAVVLTESAIEEILIRPGEVAE